MSQQSARLKSLAGVICSFDIYYFKRGYSYQTSDTGIHGLSESEVKELTADMNEALKPVLERHAARLEERAAKLAAHI